MTVYDPLDLATNMDPYPAYRRLRREAPLQSNEARGFWALSRHADVAAALHDADTFAASAHDLDATDRFFGLREAAYVAGDSDRHDALREALKPILGPRAVAAREREIGGIADSLLDELRRAAGDDGIADLAGGYARRLPVLVTCRLLGLPDADEPLLAGWVDAYFAREPGVLAVPAAALDAHRAMRAHLEERALRPDGSHAVAALLDAEASGLLTHDEVLDTAQILVEAGVKTTSTMVGTLLLALAERPDQQAAVRSAPADARLAVEEAMRFDAPAQYVSRRALRDVETRHGAIPRGARVLLLVASANRDEERHADPDPFDVARPPQRHLSFGSGLHFCAGAPLARLEGRIALQALIARAHGFELAGPPERIYTPGEREIGRLPCRVAWRRGG